MPSGQPRDLLGELEPRDEDLAHALGEVLDVADGTFEIRGLDDVERLVVAEQAGGSARVRKLVKPDAKLTLALAPLESIEGTVTVDGRAAKGFLVSALGPTARTRRVRGGGTFEIDRLDPGQYRVEARNLEGSGSATVVVEAGRAAEATIALQHFISVTGRVVDEAGQPIAVATSNPSSARSTKSAIRGSSSSSIPCARTSAA